MALKGRSERRAEEEASRETEQAGATTAAIYAADTAAEPTPEQIQPVTEADSVAGLGAKYDKTAEVAMEERELADLEAKKIRRGRLVLKKDRQRYDFLKERAAKRAINDAPAPIEESKAEAAAIDKAPAEDVAIVDPLIVEGAAAAEPEFSTTTNPEEISLSDSWSFTDSHDRKTDPDYGLREEHILRGYGWTDCQSCRRFVARLPQQLFT